MYQVGDYVVKANTGLCLVEDIVSLDHAEKDRLYYLLAPIENRRAKVYTPTDSDSVVLRSAMTADSARNLIHQISDIKEMSIENEKLRESSYKEALKSIDPTSLVSMIKTMHYRNQMRNAQGKKATAMEERYYRLAESLLYSELTHALGCRKEEIYQMIVEHISK